MPSAKTHDLITVGFTPIITYCSYLLFKDINSVILISSLFLFSSLMFNGDLDVISRPYNRWFIFKYMWKPYQKIFNHRSFLTHGIIIGTIIRIIYIIPFLLIFFYMLYLLLSNLFSNVELFNYISKMFHFFDESLIKTAIQLKRLELKDLNYLLIFKIFIGLELGNTLHTVSDKFFSKTKKIF